MESTTLTDPVCGMSIDAASSVTVEHDGRTYHFCESACADTFREDPDRWISRDELVEA